MDGSEPSEEGTHLVVVPQTTVPDRSSHTVTGVVHNIYCNLDSEYKVHKDLYIQIFQIHMICQ